MKQEDSALVVQSNHLIEARYKLENAEQRIVLAMLSMVNPFDKDFKCYVTTKEKLGKLLNISKKNSTRDIHNALFRVQDSIIYIPQDNGDFIRAHWLSSVRKEGHLYYFSFDPILKPYLLQLKSHFTKLGLTNVVHFRSAYTTRIYMLLKQYEFLGSRELELVELKAILGIPEKSYRLYKDFRKRVLDQAKKEFNRKDKETGLYLSDLNFDLKTKRTGRKISHLVFTIKQQPTKPLPKIETIEPTPEQTTEPTDPKSNPYINNLTYQALNDLGIAEEKAIELLNTHDETKINEKLALLKTFQAQTTLKNPAGFIIKALEKDYVSPEAQKKRQEEARKQAEEKARQQRLRYAEAVEQSIQNYLKTHSLEEKQLVKQAFMASDFYQNRFAIDSLLDYLYEEAESLEEALDIGEFKKSLRSFIVWHSVKNAEHLRSLEDWVAWEDQ